MADDRLRKLIEQLQGIKESMDREDKEDKVIAGMIAENEKAMAAEERQRAQETLEERWREFGKGLTPKQEEPAEAARKDFAVPKGQLSFEDAEFDRKKDEIEALRSSAWERSGKSGLANEGDMYKKFWDYSQGIRAKLLEARNARDEARQTGDYTQAFKLLAECYKIAQEMSDDAGRLMKQKEENDRRAAPPAPPAPKEPEVWIKATPMEVEAGKPVTIEWGSKNVKEVQIITSSLLPNWQKLDFQTDGSKYTTPSGQMSASLSGDTTFYINAAFEEGRPAATAEVTVHVKAETPGATTQPAAPPTPSRTPAQPATTPAMPAGTAGSIKEEAARIWDMYVDLERKIRNLRDDAPEARDELEAARSNLNFHRSRYDFGYFDTNYDFSTPHIDIEKGRKYLEGLRFDWTKRYLEEARGKAGAEKQGQISALLEDLGNLSAAIKNLVEWIKTGKKTPAQPPAAQHEAAPPASPEEGGKPYATSEWTKEERAQRRKDTFKYRGKEAGIKGRFELDEEGNIISGISRHVGRKGLGSPEVSEREMIKKGLEEHEGKDLEKSKRYYENSIKEYAFNAAVRGVAPGEFFNELLKLEDQLSEYASKDEVLRISREAKKTYAENRGRMAGPKVNLAEMELMGQLNAHGIVVPGKEKGRPAELIVPGREKKVRPEDLILPSIVSGKEDYLPRIKAEEREALFREITRYIVGGLEKGEKKESVISALRDYIKHNKNNICPHLSDSEIEDELVKGEGAVIVGAVLRERVKEETQREEQLRAAAREKLEAVPERKIKTPEETETRQRELKATEAEARKKTILKLEEAGRCPICAQTMESKQEYLVGNMYRCKNPACLSKEYYPDVFRAMSEWLDIRNELVEKHLLEKEYTEQILQRGNALDSVITDFEAGRISYEKAKSIIEDAKKRRMISGEYAEALFLKLKSAAKAKKQGEINQYAYNAAFSGVTPGEFFKELLRLEDELSEYASPGEVRKISTEAKEIYANNSRRMSGPKTKEGETKSNLAKIDERAVRITKARETAQRVIEEVEVDLVAEARNVRNEILESDLDGLMLLSASLDQYKAGVRKKIEEAKKNIMAV